ncbi:hypothetical protein BJX62DRAFT_239389 [Aspergillus germanicus]
MPPMDPEEYQSRSRLAEGEGIKFLGPLESENWPAHWPETRRNLFHDITRLGDSRFGDFQGGGSDEKPWRAQIKSRAARVAYIAARCRGEGEPFNNPVLMEAQDATGTQLSSLAQGTEQPIELCVHGIIVAHRDQVPDTGGMQKLNAMSQPFISSKSRARNGTTDGELISGKAIVLLR